MYSLACLVSLAFAATGSPVERVATESRLVSMRLLYKALLLLRAVAHVREGPCAAPHPHRPSSSVRLPLLPTTCSSRTSTMSTPHEGLTHLDATTPFEQSNIALIGSDVRGRVLTRACFDTHTSSARFAD